MKTVEGNKYFVSYGFPRFTKIMKQRLNSHFLKENTNLFTVAKYYFSAYPKYNKKLFL